MSAALGSIVGLAVGLVLGRWVERRSAARLQLKVGPNRKLHLVDTAPGRKELA